MLRQPFQPLRGVTLRLQHLLQRDLMRGVIKGQGLQPAQISHRPRLGAVIDSSVTQNESRDELTLVALILRCTFPGSDQIAHRLMRLVRDPDRGQFSGT